jgi:L-asparaginase
MARPVTILAAGGTIAMTGAAGGPASPELTGEALVAAVPALAGISGLQVRTVAVVPSAHLSGADALDIARAAAEEAATGRGVVVTHGTDTLEEVAFLTDLVYAGDAPVVFTGAMRPASAPGADGPANLADAVTVAASDEAAACGVLVVFAGEIHAARGVRKADSTALAAFQSPHLGAVGRVDEGRVLVERSLERRGAFAPAHLDSVVEIIVASVGSDGRLPDAAVAAGCDGLIAVLLGAGHTPPKLLAGLERAAAAIPVVATVRPKRGAILRDTYAFEGSERDLRDGPIVPAGSLSSAHARIKLMVCLGAGLDRDAIRAAFASDDR